MNASDIAALLSKYGSSGILLDTNMLLVYVLGRYDPDRIEKFKRTNTFRKEDFVFLSQFVRHFHRIVATPHILTEVSNLAANLAEPCRSACFESLRSDISRFHEIWDSAVTIVSSPVFQRLGLTDAGISIAAKQEYLVLTDDLDLYTTLWKYGVEAINFNHIRLSGWSS